MILARTRLSGIGPLILSTKTIPRIACMGNSSRKMATTNLGGGRSRLQNSEPAFIYGTAWKKDKTAELVKDAIANGFRRVDTAAQPRHYQEELVGEGLRECYQKGLVKREDIYVQTKYTTPAGQDHENMPYHPLDSLETQIHTSVSSSLKNLRPSENSEDNSYVDCLLLHSPLPTIEQTLQAWKLLESYVPHKIRSLGISNVTLEILQTIYDNSTVKPSVVQNRFYPKTSFDVPLRDFCHQHDITYQSFWTLTGNPALLKCAPVATLAKAVGVDKSVALYALVMDLGVEVLNGTTSVAHMKDDFEGIRKVKEWVTSHENESVKISDGFRKLVSPAAGS